MLTRMSVSVPLVPVKEYHVTLEEGIADTRQFGTCIAEDNMRNEVGLRRAVENRSLNAG